MTDTRTGHVPLLDPVPASAREDPRTRLAAFASMSSEEVAARFECDTSGLSESQAAERLVRFGPNSLPAAGHPAIRILGRQMKNPLSPC